MKKLAILQSNYLPWKGYFDILGSVDEFIIYDDVQYTKNDWRNRNKIKTQHGVKWITVPVYQKNLQQKIAETKTSQTNWQKKHWEFIKSSYSKAKCFQSYSEPFAEFYLNFKSEYLSEINVTLIKIAAQQLNIKTVISNSADYELKGNATERLVELCVKTKSTTYVSGPAAKNYLDENLFKEANVRIEWMDYSNYPVYDQCFPPFTHEVSIIDLLFNMGAESTTYMKFEKLCN